MNFPSLDTLSDAGASPGDPLPSSLSGRTRSIYYRFRRPPHAMARAPRRQVGDPAAAPGVNRAALLAVLSRHLARAGRRSPRAAARSGRARPGGPPADGRADAAGVDPDDAVVLRPARLF